MTIPLLKPSVSEREIEAVSQVLRSGWWGMGPKCEEFEERIARLHGYPYAVTVNSATAALHLAMLLMGVGPGSEVILPALTFVSTGLAAKYVGAEPLFADVRADTLTINWEDARQKASSGYPFVIPVDYAGYPAGPAVYWDGMVVQDAAHTAIGPSYGEIKVLSFHPVKPMATGDGGAILLNSREDYERAKALRWCGIDKSTYDRTKSRYGWDYQIEELGYKWHWNDIQAAIGLVQLERAAELTKKRWQIATKYSQALEDERITLPAQHAQHSWHLYVVRVDERKRVMDYMLERGISVGVHYKPLTSYPMFEPAQLPVTDREWRRMISLPIYPDMTDGEQAYVIETLQEALDA